MKRLIVQGSARVLLVLVVCVLSSAQTTRPEHGTTEGEANAYPSPLADSFQTQQGYVNSSEKSDPDKQPPGYISGTILDQSGAVTLGAQVRLSNEGHASNQEIRSGRNGEFL